MKKVYAFFKIFTMLLVLVLTATIVKAQKTAIASGNWDAAATWQGGVPPVLADAVTINDGVEVIVNIANAQCASINILGGAADGGITILNSSSELTVTNGVTINAGTDNNVVKSIAVGAGIFSCGSLTLADVTTGNPQTDVIISVSIGTVTISGNVIMNGSASENFINITGVGTLNLGGSISTATGALSAAAGSIVNYNGGAQTVRAITYSNLILSGSGAKTITGSTINSILSMRGTATIAGTSPTYGAASTLDYSGSVAQTTTAVEFPATGGPFNLSINNTGGVTLHAARTISGNLDLFSGIFTTTTANLLTINAAGTVSWASNASFISGPLSKVGTAAFTFPVGRTGSGYVPVAIGAAAASNTFTAEYLRGVPPNNTNITAPNITNISSCDYWTLNRTAGTSAVNVTLYWNSNNPCGSAPYVLNPAGIKAVHYNGTAWNTASPGVGTGTPSDGSVTWVANNIFSPFALGAIAGISNPLPVLFVDVKAFEKNSGVQIEWSNLTEKDLVNYIVERSANGQNFSAISEQLPRSNQNSKESYASFDASPFAGANFYRIKVLELSGKVVYSKILKVVTGGTGHGFTLYPNPVKGNQVTIGINAKQGQYTLTVMSTGGQKVFIQKLMHQGGNMSQAIELPASVKPGAYNMTISGDNYREAKMFIVQ